MEKETQNGRDNGGIQSGRQSANDGDSNGFTRRKLNVDAVNKLRKSKLDFGIGGETNSSRDSARVNVGIEFSGESGTGSRGDIGIGQQSGSMPSESGRENGPIAKPVDDRGNTGRAIEFTSGREERRPRTIDWGTDDEQEQTSNVSSVKTPKTTTGTRTRKQVVTADTASVVIQLLFGILVITLGEHWQQSDEAILAAAEPLSRILSKLPKSKTDFLNTYLDPILFAYAMICMCSTPLKVEFQRAKGIIKIPAKRNNVNGTPVNQTVDTREQSNGYHPEYGLGEQSLFRGFENPNGFN